MITIHEPEVGDTICWHKLTEKLTEVTSEYVKSPSLYFSRVPHVTERWDVIVVWYEGVWVDRYTLLERQRGKLLTDNPAALFVGGSMDGKRMALPGQPHTWFAHRLESPVTGGWVKQEEMSRLPTGPNISEEIYERCEVKTPSVDGKLRTEILMVYRGPVQQPKVGDAIVLRPDNGTLHTFIIDNIYGGDVYAHNAIGPTPMSAYPKILVPLDTLFYKFEWNGWGVKSGTQVVWTDTTHRTVIAA